MISKFWLRKSLLRPCLESENSCKDFVYPKIWKLGNYKPYSTWKSNFLESWNMSTLSLKSRQQKPKRMPYPGVLKYYSCACKEYFASTKPALFDIEKWTNIKLVSIPPIPLRTFDKDSNLLFMIPELEYCYFTVIIRATNPYRSFTHFSIIRMKYSEIY